jgi:hypothetical protein
MADLLVIVPTRGRPESLPLVADCWTATGAWADAELRFVVDADDPAWPEYRRAFQAANIPPQKRNLEQLTTVPKWEPLVPKLNWTALHWARKFYAVAFMGDDHRPRTPGWAATMLAVLRDLRTGIVYGDDLLQGERLCTAWAMTSDIVTALGRMVPAPVEHMFCDNAVMDLGNGADCLRYLPDVVIEHCHPLAGKSAWDVGYQQVNSRVQYMVDGEAYGKWHAEQLDQDVAAVEALRVKSAPQTHVPQGKRIE